MGVPATGISAVAYWRGRIVLQTALSMGQGKHARGESQRSSPANSGPSTLFRLAGVDFFHGGAGVGIFIQNPRRFCRILFPYQQRNI
jgi:hypothetical protein